MLCLNIVFNYCTIALQLSVAQETCRIGINDERSFAAASSVAGRFYVNEASPASCDGIVTSWRVCYYGPQSMGNNDRVTNFGVYRRSGDGGQLIQLSGSLSTVTLGRTSLTSGFNCLNISITNGDLSVQINDVVGACVVDPTGSSKELNIVGEASGHSLSMTDGAGCGSNQIPSLIEATQLSTIDSRILHIYANIGKLCA